MSNVFWITGLSAAGKTTLARLVADRLRERGVPVVMFDGDELREALGATTDHSQNARLVLAFNYARLAKLVASQGITVVVSAVALIKEIHQWNQDNQPGYFEVYLKVALDELRRRDPKGIYRRFDAGELSNVAGLDMPVDEPLNPDLVIEYKHGLAPHIELDRLMGAFDRIYPTLS